MRAASTRLDGQRDRSLADLARQPIRAAIAVEYTLLGQSLHDLLDEERLASGALANQLGEPVKRRIAPEQRSQQLLDRLAAKRRQCERRQGTTFERVA
jgi:hypothetical protein